MGYWNKIASVQKSKIVSTYSGQIVDLHSFFPSISGNYMVIAQVGSVFSNQQWISGIRAYVEDLGNYVYRGWVQCSNSYLTFKRGNDIFNGVMINPYEIHNYQNFENVRCKTFGWSITHSSNFVNSSGYIIFGDNAGQFVNRFYNVSNHHMSTFTLPNVPYNSTGMYVLNQGNSQLWYYMEIYQSRWENCEGIVNLFISESRY